MTATSRSLAPAALLIFFSLLVGGAPSAELAAASTDAEESLRCAVDRVSIVQDSDFPAPEGEKLIGVEVQFLKWRKYHSPDEIVAFNDTTANDAGRAMFLYAQRLARRSPTWQDGGTQESAAEESPRFLLIFSVPVSWRAVKLGYQHSCGDLTVVASPIGDSRHAAANGEATADHSQVKPDCADAYRERGQAWCLKGELDEAIADYSRALRLDPNHVKGYNRRASAWSGKGEYDKAIADCNQALRLRPDDAEATTTVARCGATKASTTKPLLILSKPYDSSPITQKPTRTSLGCKQRVPTIDTDAGKKQSRTQNERAKRAGPIQPSGGISLRRSQRPMPKTGSLTRPWKRRRRQSKWPRQVGTPRKRPRQNFAQC